MDNGAPVRFIRRNGKVIPIRAIQGGAKAAGGGKLAKAAKAASLSRRAVGAASLGAVAVAVKRKEKPSPVRVNPALDILGLGTSIASGAIGAATFSGGTKAFIGGAVASHVVDAAGISANIAAVAGRGHVRKRAELAAKHEARNFLVGNAVFVAGILGSRANRAAAAGMIKAGAGGALKLAGLAKKALRRG